MSRVFVESELCAAYTEEATYYTSALETADTLFAALGQGQDGEALLNRIVELLGQVAGIEGRIAEVKQCWRTTGQKPGRELNAALLEVENLIQRLRARLDAAEQEARKHRTALVPRLDGLIRGQHMRRG